VYNPISPDRRKIYQADTYKAEEYRQEEKLRRQLEMERMQKRKDFARQFRLLGRSKDVKRSLQVNNTFSEQTQTTKDL
jgi:hypothetical protein